MRVWIDIANSPHAVLFEPVVKAMEAAGWTALLTARDHAQTVELSRERWPDVTVVGGPSPGSRVGKAASTATRSAELARAARRFRPDVALSHGSYAQLLAARMVGIRAATMMDYEYQPANHLSFRLAARVIVPEAFPADQLRRFGARPDKVLRYAGFKEELYLADFVPAGGVAESLDVDPAKVVVILRPPPKGALYHRAHNDRFDRVVALCVSRPDTEAILLPRNEAQRRHFLEAGRITVPEHAVDGLSLLAEADVALGAGGTMNREAALLGVPTYTLFAGRLAAVDASLLELGYMRDLRTVNGLPGLAKRGDRRANASAENGRALLKLILESVENLAPSRAVARR